MTRLSAARGVVFPSAANRLKDESAFVVPRVVKMVKDSKTGRHIMEGQSRPLKHVNVKGYVRF